MILERIEFATGEFQQIDLKRTSTAESDDTSVTITAPAVLITLDIVQQMRERKRQLQALKAWAATQNAQVGR